MAIILFILKLKASFCSGFLFVVEGFGDDDINERRTRRGMLLAMIIARTSAEVRQCFLLPGDTKWAVL